MDDIEVLWLDDDSPKKVEGYRGIKVVTAQSCGEAEKLLISGQVRPQWAIVDLIVPQGGWGGKAKRTPGLYYINHLKMKYGNDLGIIAFSIVMPDWMRKKVLEAGAQEAIAKSTTSWAALLADLRSRSNPGQRGDKQIEPKTRKEQETEG